MIKYSKETKPESIHEYMQILVDRGQDNWIHSHNEYWYMIFYKEIAKTNTPVEWKETKEYIEFITYYRKEINNKNSSAKTIPRKYELALEENNPNTWKKVTHSDLMKATKNYWEYVKAFNQYPVWVQVYLNNRRYLEEYETVKVNYEEKWITDTMKDRGIDESHQERILTAVRIWRKSYEPVKEFTSMTLEMMINKIWENKDYS